MSEAHVILMYHALYETERDLLDIAPEDRPYAVDMASFRKQLDHIQAAGLTVLRDSSELPGGKRSPGVLITFDDGHISNYRLAFPELMRRNWQATFFVTTDFIGQREHFCTWAQLKEMAAAGMIIGGHGQSHRFFSDMPPSEATQELTSSRQAILEHIGSAACPMSFPGGRFLQTHLKMACKAGFDACHTSQVGTVNINLQRPVLVGLPRMAIRATTSLAEFKKIVSGATTYYAISKAKWIGKEFIKKILGNRLYHKTYAQLAK